MTTPSPFELGEDQRALRDLVRRVAEEKVAPRAAEIDATGDYPQDMYDKKNASCRASPMGTCVRRSR